MSLRLDSDRRDTRLYLVDSQEGRLAIGFQQGVSRMTRCVRFSIGDMEAFALNDGELDFGNEIFPSLDQDSIADLLKAAGKGTIKTNFNALLLKSRDSCVLIDTGAGEAFGPSAGFIQDALKEAGIAPHEIATLVITHLHPDHFGGAVDASGGRVFPNAEVVLPERELNHWKSDANFVGADEAAVQWRSLALSFLDCYDGRLRTARQDGEVAPGLYFLDLPGHTPGHTGCHVEANGKEFVYIADILHAQDLQFANPEICAVFDVDTETAIKSRKRILDRIATDDLVFFGGHMLGCQISRLEKVGAGYRLVQ